MAAALDEALGALGREQGDRVWSLASLVIGTGEHLDIGEGTLEIGHFFGPLVDEEDHEVDLVLVILEEALGDVVEEGGLAGAGRGDNEPALSAPDGSDEIDDPVVKREGSSRG